MEQAVRKQIQFLEKGMIKTISQVLLNIREFKGKKLNMKFPQITDQRRPSGQISPQMMKKFMAVQQMNNHYSTPGPQQKSVNLNGIAENQKLQIYTSKRANDQVQAKAKKVEPKLDAQQAPPKVLEEIKQEAQANNSNKSSER